jgi:hypothetical protein
MTWLLLILARLFGRPRYVPRQADLRVQLAGLESVEAFFVLLAQYIADGKPEDFNDPHARWACRWLDYLTRLAWRHAPRAARSLAPLKTIPRTLTETFARLQLIGAVLLAPAEPPLKRNKRLRRRPRLINRKPRLTSAHAPRALELSG